MNKAVRACPWPIQLVTPSFHSPSTLFLAFFNSKQSYLPPEVKVNFPSHSPSPGPGSRDGHWELSSTSISCRSAECKQLYRRGKMYPSPGDRFVGCLATKQHAYGKNPIILPTPPHPVIRHHFPYFCDVAQARRLFASSVSPLSDGYSRRSLHLHFYLRFYFWGAGLWYRTGSLRSISVTNSDYAPLPFKTERVVSAEDLL
jgi:hypothetical protein